MLRIPVRLSLLLVALTSYGVADRQRQVPNTVNTRFPLGSMPKMFTAVAMLTLVEAGRVVLDDPLGKHLTDYPEPEVRSKVTVRHLLMHTGGTGDIFGPQFFETRPALRFVDSASIRSLR